MSGRKIAATITHGRHCTCSACERQDWSEPQLACCGMHGPSCPPVYAPLGAPGQPDPSAASFHTDSTDLHTCGDSGSAASFHTDSTDLHTCGDSGSAACTCPPGQPENVTDAQCPQHGVLAFLASGAVDQPDEPDESSAARGYVGPVAHEITFDAQREPMFQDEQGNGWVPLATYDERCDEVADLKNRLGYPRFAR